MIIKLFGMIIIMFSSVALGFRMSDAMVQREYELKNLSDALTMMLGELGYTHSCIKDIFFKVNSLVKGETRELFDCICTKLERGESASIAWSTSVGENIDLMSLKPADCNQLQNYGYLLEAYGLDEQKTNLEALKMRVDSLAVDAEQFKKKNSRIVRMLGIYGGILLCIIVF